jgi:hypothetical protein
MYYYTFHIDRVQCINILLRVLSTFSLRISLVYFFLLNFMSSFGIVTRKLGKLSGSCIPERRILARWESTESAEKFFRKRI